MRVWYTPRAVPVVVVHYNEVALKGRNRGFFSGRLADHLRRVGRDVGVREVSPLPGRIVLRLREDARWPELRARLAEVYGVVNFALAEETPIDVALWKKRGLELLQAANPPHFRVRAKRTDKSLALLSPTVNAEVGGHMHMATGIPVKLDGAAFELRIELLRDGALLYAERHAGAGGLPVGVSGRVVALLSGGFDSPVAAARMMRRGCHVIFVHFHSHPYLDTSSQEKVRALAARLVRRQLKAKLFLVPFGDLQREIVSRCAPAARVVVYRRFMVRIADLIAEREEASALVTGESVGQVASQTLANLSLIGQVGKRLVLRPLIGMDKDEIIREAKALGTYDISIQRDQDCCALFLPRSPATRAAPGIIARAEAGMEIERVVREAADAAQEIEIRFPG